jgi:molybdate transport system substrate-binding protein
MKKIFLILLVGNIFLSSLLAKQKPVLLFYCGITMVKPMVEISKIIEKKYNCEIKIIQGGSEDLYQSLSYSKKGDLYLPGSDSYRIKHLKDGYFLDNKYIGFNQAAIFVQKGNPKHLKGLDDLVNEDISSILCNPKSGSIGKMTKKILYAYKGEEFFEDAYDITLEIGTDSRNINKAIISKRVDIAINWRATKFWKENNKDIDLIPIDKKYAPKKKLVLNILSFSKLKVIEQSLLKLACSSECITIMKKYGFR